MILRYEDAREADIRRFTEGDCWLLARTLWKRHGWQPCAFCSGDGIGDLHAFVRLPNGHYLDIVGIWNEPGLKSEWTAADIGPVDPSNLREWGPPLSFWSYKRVRKIANELHSWALKVCPELADTSP